MKSDLVPFINHQDPHRHSGSSYETFERPTPKLLSCSESNDSTGYGYGYGKCNSVSNATNIAMEQHKERHGFHGDLVRDSIIGFADGLTVPFALTAGLSSLGSTRIVILGGLAELFAGAISMGLGAFLASVTEKQHYELQEKRERIEVRECPEEEEQEISDIFAHYGISKDDCAGVINALKQNEDMWVKFMMDFELRLTKPEPSRAWIEGLVMGLSYFFGGLLPMVPYFVLNSVVHALLISIGITAVILLAFGYVKALIMGSRHIDAGWSALQTLFIGAIAASVSYGIVKLVGQVNSS